MSKYEAYQCDLCKEPGLTNENVVNVKNILVQIEDSSYRLNYGHLCVDCSNKIEELLMPIKD